MAESGASTAGDAWLLVTDEFGQLESAALGAVSELRRSLPSTRCVALWVGPVLESADLDELALAGAGALVHLATEGGWTARTASVAVAALLRGRTDVRAVVFPATLPGREFAGRVSGLAALGLTGDAIGVAERPDGSIVFEKPSFGGGVIAEIRTRTRPALATVRFAVFAPGRAESPARLVPELGPTVASDPKVRTIERGDDPLDPLPDPDRARVVVSVGMGAAEPDMLRQVRRLAAAWGAAVVATRRVVDAGLVPVSRQVGLTGRSVAPDLGVLLGIRGSPNHLIAWRRAKVLLAVNPDPTAPVFAGVDVGIVGRCEEVLPFLEEEIPRLLAR